MSKWVPKPGERVLVEVQSVRGSFVDVNAGYGYTTSMYISALRPAPAPAPEPRWMPSSSTRAQP